MPGLIPWTIAGLIGAAVLYRHRAALRSPAPAGAPPPPPFVPPNAAAPAVAPRVDLVDLSLDYRAKREEEERIVAAKDFLDTMTKFVKAGGPAPK